MKFKAVLNKILIKNRKNKNVRDILKFIKDVQDKYTNYDKRLEGTPIYALNPESPDYKKHPPRILTDKEVKKYIKSYKRTKKVTKSSNRKNNKIVDYTEKRNRI
tara:strand:+ start:11221 stop:11532 length:312 start_codon:yes stop_codon:yes gene_type:complete